MVNQEPDITPAIANDNKNLRTTPESSNSDSDYDEDMKSIDSSNTSYSAPSDDDNADREPLSYKSVNIPTLQPQPLKRSHSMRASDTPPSSPTTKRVRSTTSSIREALERKEGPQGILLFFRKATDEEHREWLKRTYAGDAEDVETMEWEKEREDQILQVKKRRNATKRKQKQRAKEKKRDILAGLRSPRGSKIKVGHLMLDTSKGDLINYLQVTEVQLQDTPSIDMGGSVPELSRPANPLKEKFKAKVRKASGRKRKNAEKPTKYHNWFTPFLFKQIELARINSGGPKWSTRAITRKLQKKDFATFKGLRRTTMDGWIDRSGVKPCWSEKTLQRVRRGNEPGHANGGRRGVLVSNC